MPRVPDKDSELITWASERITAWTGQGTPPDIGLDSAQVAEAATKLATLEAAMDEVINIRALSTAATSTKDNAASELRTNLGGLIGIIEGYAKSTGDPDVYNRALIPAPKPASPRSEAATPTEALADGLPDGSVEFTFKVAAGSGASFEVQRRITPLDGIDGGWQPLTTTGEKKYLDLAVPVGQRRVEYRARVVLSNNVKGEWSTPAPFDFGSAGSQGGPVGLAA